MNAPTAWQLLRDPDGIARLLLDRPGASANTLSRAVILELEARLDELAAAAPRGLIIVSGKASGFIAGADITEFTQLAAVEQAYEVVRAGQRAFDKIEALPCPTVAQIHGFALGGGLELALACTYRAGADDGRLALGLPEVQLGIHPGFGGSVRSVRLLGVRKAMDLMLTGKTVRGEQALAIGLVDRLVPAAQLDAAARELIERRPPPHRPAFTERLLSSALVRPFIAPALERQVQKRVRREHYPAPYALIDLWRRGARGPKAYEEEARSISAMFLTPTSRNLVRVFLLQDRLKGLAGKATTPARRAHVVGAGVMGGDIAAWCALRGLEVTLQDKAPEYVERAVTRAGELFGKRLRGPGEAQAARARLRAATAGEPLAGVDVAIEAIFEDAAAKRALFAELEPRLPPAALLASNTSSIVLEDLAKDLADPGRLVGLHFFNPVAQMPLVEVVHTASTHAQVRSAALAFVRRIDKLPLPCRSSPGFLVNRVLSPYLQEAMLALEEGIAPEIVDAAAERFGMPMGPIELADVVGLDVCKHVGEIVGGALGRPPPRPLTRLVALVAAKHLGRKSGHGFYEWHEGKPRKTPVAGANLPADLQDRLVLTLVNESVACLRERVVEDADLVDAGIIFGAGFAPFRGGPLQYARERGLAEVRARLEGLARQHGPRFAPDAGWALLGP